MVKRLKVVLPIVQVILVVTAYALPKLPTSLETSGVLLAFRDFVTKLNFPLAVVLFPVAYILERFTPYMPSISARYLVVVVAAVSVLLASVVAVFWYMVVKEIEMRRQRQSLFHFQNRAGQIVAISIMLAMGAGGVLYAYVYARKMFYFRPAEGVAGAACLALWGVALILLSIKDTARLFEPGATVGSR